MRKLLYIFFATILFISCGRDHHRKGGFDFSALTSKMNLSVEKEKQYTDIVKKYAKMRDEIMATAKKGKSDRTLTMNKMQNLLINQTKEVSNILDAEQMKVYNTLVEKIRKMRSPGYSKELITKLITDLKLNDEQIKMLNATNKAFEKAYIDAHDYYHGNNEAAKEYWNKYDTERKKALQKVFTEEQYNQFLELVKNQGFKGEHG